MARFLIENTASPIDFESNKDSNTVRTLQNCKNLLRCRKGEVPYDRMRGINPVIFDMPLPKLNGVLLSEIDRVLAWEPDARAISAKAVMDKDGQIVISVAVEIAE